MHLHGNEKERWTTMANAVAVIQRQDPHFKVKTEFRMGDPLIKEWVQDVLAPSLLDGDAGVIACLLSVEAEADAVARALKIELTEQWWGNFDAETPADVVVYLKTQGIEKDALQHALIDTHFPPVSTPELLQQVKETFAAAHGLDPDDIDVQSDTPLQTYH